MILGIISSASLLYLSFPNIFFVQGLPFLAWIFAVPLFYCLEKKSLAERLKVGFCFGLVSNLALVNWMISYSVSGYLLLSVALTSQAVIFAVLYRPLQKNKVWNVVYVAALWVISEYLRKGLMLGESWNLAHSQTFDVALMQIANLGGSAVISFVLMAMNVAVYQALVQKENLGNRMTGVVVAVAMFAVAYSYGFFVLATSCLPTGPVIKICVLQTDHDYRGDLTDERINNIVNKNIVLTREALALHSETDLVIWPETAIPTDFRENARLQEQMSGLAKKVKTNILFGAALYDQADFGESLRRQHNSAVLIDAQGQIKYVYHKRHLIPLTEYIPDTWLWKTFARIFKVQTSDLVAGHDNDAGMMKILLRNGHVVHFGVAICSEDNIDRIFYDYRRQGAQFIVVLLNNGWFGQKEGALMHAQHSMVRAVENHVPVIRAANAGWSGFIDEFGGLSDQSVGSSGENKFLNREILLSNRKSQRNNREDTFCLLCGGFVILLTLISKIKGGL